MDRAFRSEVCFLANVKAVQLMLFQHVIAKVAKAMLGSAVGIELTDWALNRSHTCAESVDDFFGDRSRHG
ncbi:MAG TPA: hypothetical protein VGP79_15665 [Bryobacteraceae bacterium]|jgi:hypothetical protein|nr:hypothetical protein [Bryobacteraceae bacterium]